ncbi:MAG TPA: hypothetical protein VMU36_14055 [Spirochaetia bacterium]|nr:hypothetical protein [Spirochaetia bacterium]
MRSFWLALVLAASLAAALPLAASAIGVDIEAKGSGGLALGSTTNPDESGSPRAALIGGVGADVFLLTVGPVDLGFSVGAEYDYLMFHGVLNNFASAMVGPGYTQTTDNVYAYLQFPISVVGRVPLTESLALTLRAGAFIGHFLGGTSSASYNSNPFGFPTSITLDSSNTIVGEYGLHFTGGVDIALGSNFSLSPAVQLDMGLTNTQATNPSGAPGAYPYSDTFWSVTATIGIKYTVF